jgi:hypothetical protein
MPGHLAGHFLLGEAPTRKNARKPGVILEIEGKFGSSASRLV